MKSTKSDRNYKLVWYCGFPTDKQAINYEKYLKTGSGIAFIKKRFLKSHLVALEKDNISDSGLIITRSSKNEVYNPARGTSSVSKTAPGN
ncbi:hypothetical protein A3D78_01340 [Candidatus Gottesmanbacteria bacterium RIFCSPHIGHO2_02_FULL_39_14]|uniref:GIY-YIG domain-containing protein n=1 Tax=Candidatus Gottesmanbacteria bacterium RIFCSPHIGHO2_02_FULL_39_14 TaxID=1798383 RepID=A0A1F5ZUD1_9BACT|nr:MAG: hypothetical protein A3D78_01340 [Candidatus Gottesmanbacteria bacterium RIFCSPHIGHO2_02_FULL_39_14]